MEDDAADELHVVRAQAERALRRLTDGREGLEDELSSASPFARRSLNSAVLPFNSSSERASKSGSSDVM